MAITNAQQFKQLVNPPMKGNKRPGYRGTGEYGGMGGGTGSGLDEGPANGGTGGGKGGEARDRAMGLQGKTGRVDTSLDTGGGFDKVDRSRTKTIDRLNRIAEIEKFIDRPTFGFTDAAKVNLLSPRSILGGLRSLASMPTTPPTSVSGGEGDGPVPYWAQLGFNSEAEYLASLAAQAPSTEEQETEEEAPFQLARRFRAEGGIMNADVVGGEFDFESARQMYGLGKLVKKVGKTVKKIAKSDIGKAAILGAVAFGIPGTGLGGIFGRASFGGYAPGMFGFGGIGNAIAAGKAKFLSKPFTKTVADFGLDRQAFNAARTAAGTSGGLGIGSAIIGTSIAAGLLTPEEEQQAQELADNTGFDIEKARNSILAARREQYMMDERARGFRAEGGPAEGKEPVAKKTMPLLDMGGKEMDLREEGGFVPIGRMEKADDVPARLSKNEFVFTADAVRNAGDGSVDKGAEVMYNMMKNLEAGGDVSGESQGLKGARKMFQTSQRLEEVL